ncbi:hypothetical protein ACFX1T_043278 [Malus domestica]
MTRWVCGKCLILLGFLEGSATSGLFPVGMLPLFQMGVDSIVKHISNQQGCGSGNNLSKITLVQPYNVKRAMPCPDCRKIEKGPWLYSNGCRSFLEFSMDDWTHDEDLYDLSYLKWSRSVLSFCERSSYKWRVEVKSILSLMMSCRQIAAL